MSSPPLRKEEAEREKLKDFGKTLLGSFLVSEGYGGGGADGGGDPMASIIDGVCYLMPKGSDKTGVKGKRISNDTLFHFEKFREAGPWMGSHNKVFNVHAAPGCYISCVHVWDKAENGSSGVAQVPAPVGYPICKVASIMINGNLMSGVDWEIRAWQTRA